MIKSTPAKLIKIKIQSQFSGKTQTKIIRLEHKSHCIASGLWGAWTLTRPTVPLRTCDYTLCSLLYASSQFIYSLENKLLDKFKTRPISYISCVFGTRAASSKDNKQHNGFDGWENWNPHILREISGLQHPDIREKMQKRTSKLSVCFSRVILGFSLL